MITNQRDKVPYLIDISRLDDTPNSLVTMLVTMFFGFDSARSVARYRLCSQRRRMFCVFPQFMECISARPLGTYSQVLPTMQKDAASKLEKMLYGT